MKTTKQRTVTVRMTAVVAVAMTVFLGLPIRAIAEPTWAGVATHDGMYAPAVNPAALAVGNATGLGAEIPIEFPPESFSLYFNTDWLGYTLDSSPDGVDHLIAAAAGFGHTLSVGSSWRWTGTGFRDGSLQLAALSRINRAISIGAVARDVAGDGDMILGIGLRPLSFVPDLGTRLTIGADARWSYGLDFALANVHAHFEPIDGLHLSGGYEPESGALSLGLTVNTRYLAAGVRTAEPAEPGASVSLFAAARQRRSALARIAPTVAEYDHLETVTPVPGLRVFGPERSLSSILADITRLQADPSVHGIVIKNNVGPESFAMVQELRDALEAFRAAGKRVYYYFDSVTNLNYTLAAATGDVILLHPLGTVDLRGPSHTGVYAEELLDYVGITFHRYARDEYKIGLEPLTESAMTDAERETWQAIIDDRYATQIEMIATGRADRLTVSARDAVDGGPYLEARGALELGLVDALAYPDEIWDVVAEFHPRARQTEYARLPVATYQWAPPPRSRVAVIYAVGNIVTGDGLRGMMIGSDTMAEAIRTAREDPATRGIILRIESGGGSAIASDIIAREVAKTVEAGKPVVVSMGELAMSGGYYIAAPASHIVASPGTLTGSIGVLVAHATVHELLEQIGIETETITTSPSSDFGSPLRPPGPEEDAAFERALDAIYDRFLEVVAESRDMTVDEAHEMAQGRIWTGRQALTLGLVDSLGGMAQSFAVMQSLLETRELEIVEIVPGGTPTGLLTGIPTELGLRRFLPAATTELVATYAMVRRHSGEALYFAPYRLSVKQ